MKKNKETVLWTLKHAVFFGTMEMFYNPSFLAFPKVQRVAAREAGVFGAFF